MATETPRLTFVTTCMGRLDLLRRTLGRMVGQPGGSCVVVDYSCPERSGEWVEAHYPQAKVVRVPGQTRFHLAAARNFGAQAAETPWLVFVDADVLLDPGFAGALAPCLAPGGYYRAAADDAGLGGTFACARDDFARVGGFDEVYRGWGEEDNDLYDALAFAGLEARPLPPGRLSHLPHPEEARSANYEITDRALGHAVNRVYRLLKWDTARLRREWLTYETRRAIYEKVSEVVTASLGQGRPGDLAVRMPPGIVPGGWSLARTMTYRLSRDG